jgi:hypothetical protein
MIECQTRCLKDLRIENVHYKEERKLFHQSDYDFMIGKSKMHESIKKLYAAKNCREPQTHAILLYSKLSYARHRPATREILLSLAAALVYFWIRGLTSGSIDAALVNAARLMRFEQTANMAWEESLQAAVIARFSLVTLFNWIYIWGHWPVIIATAIVLFIHRPGQYRLLRNTIYISGAIGFLFFIFFPVAPPRLASPEMVDTVTLYSHSYRAFQPPDLTNQFAAFPSLHFGWNMLVGVAMWLATANIILRSVAVVQAVAMGAAVVLTANHYVIDVAFGFVVVLVGLSIHQVIVSRSVVKKPSGLEPSCLLHSNDGLYNSPPGRK